MIRTSEARHRLGLVDSDELRALFGWSKSTAYRRQRDGMPVIKAGKAPLYNPESVRAWLLSQERSAGVPAA